MVVSLKIWVLCHSHDMNHSFMHGINEFEVKEVRKMMKSSKDVGPYGIFIELWRYL